MKTRLICASVAAVIAAWAPAGSAGPPQTVDLTGGGVVNAVGEVDGVLTNNNGVLTVGTRNINTNGVNADAIQQNPVSAANVLFGFSSTVTGNVGTAVSPIFNIDAGAPATTVTFGGGTVFATTLNVTGTGTVNFNGNTTAAATFAGDGFINLGAGRTLTGAIMSNTASTGTLTLNGGSKVVGAIGGAPGAALKQINVAGGDAQITGAVFARAFSLGTNTLTINAGGALTPSVGATFATSFANNAVFGNINVLGASNVTSSVTVIPTVGGPLTVGTTYVIVNGTAGGTIGTTVLVINNDPRFAFIGVPVNIQGQVRITLAAAASLAPLGAPPAAAAVGPVLITPAAPGSDLLAVQSALFALPIAAVNNALGQLSPGTTNLAAPWVAGQATRMFEDLWMARAEEIQDLCCDTCEPGKSGAPVNAHKCTGPEQRSNWWGKAFGNWGHQGDVNSLNGYNTKAAGLMLAWDTPLSNGTRAGLGGGYANTTIDGNNSTGTTKIDSYQLTAYLSHAPGPWFVHGAVTVGADKYNGSRPIVFPGVNRTANADYTGQQYTALVAAGRHFPFNWATVTPLASLQASRIRVGSYTESGAGDANLRVNNQDYDFVQSSLGVKAERVMRSANGTYSPEVHVKWLHDFGSTTMLQNAAFTGGGGTFTTQGVTQDRDLYNVGAGVTFLGCRCGEQTWTVKGLYDYKWNQSSYASHQLSVIASIKF